MKIYKTKARKINLIFMCRWDMFWINRWKNKHSQFYGKKLKLNKNLRAEHINKLAIEMDLPF